MAGFCEKLSSGLVGIAGMPWESVCGWLFVAVILLFVAVMGFLWGLARVLGWFLGEVDKARGKGGTR